MRSMYESGGSRLINGPETEPAIGSSAALHPLCTSKPGWTRRTRSLLGVQIVSTGSYVPDPIVTNFDLQRLYGYDPAWIEQRTGIRARRHARPDQATSD